MRQQHHLSGGPRPWLYSLLPVLGTASLDFWARGHQILGLNRTGGGFYLWSLLFAWLCWQGVALLGRRLQSRRGSGVAFAVMTLVALGYSALRVSVQSYREYFGAYPNLFTFEFLYEELGESLHILSTGTTGASFLLIILLTALLTAWLRGTMGPFALPLQRRSALTLTIFGVVSLVPLHNNARTYPGAFLPEVQAAFCLTRATQNTLTGKSKPIRILSTGYRKQLPVVESPLPFNVLFVIHESLRADRLSLYGYERQTTPQLDAFVTARRDRVIVYPRAYANATRTMLAFPGLLSGVSPAQRASLLHRAPLFFDYGKMFPNAKSFLISAHMLEWGNVIEFLRNSSIDHLWHKSTGEVPPMHRRAVDDKHLAPTLAAFLDNQVATEDGERFFGVLHFRGTHGPYHSSETSRRWPTTTYSNRYDNSVRYLDEVDAAVREVLKHRELLDNTLIIATADHGEALGEHGYKGHVHTFFEEEAHIPMWVHLPDSLLQDPELRAAMQANAEGPNAVANTDILPTVLHLAGIDEHPEVAASLALLPGQSLAKPLPPHRPVIMQNHNDVNNRYLYGGVGLVMDNIKYLLRTEEQRVWQEAYDLNADPLEKNNLWPLSPKLRETIYDALLSQPNSRQVLQSQQHALKEKIAGLTKN